MPGAVKEQGSGWTRVASVSSYEVGTVCPERHFTQRGHAMLGKVVTFETQNQRLALLAVLSFIALC
jgi:hypothetical protein